MRATTTKTGVEPSLTLTAAETAELLGTAYSAEKIRKLYRDGHFPPPINPTATARQWTWSRRKVEQYVDEGVAA
jgi:predicted DNA-binding transcriptional regulator AlpA